MVNIENYELLFQIGGGAYGNVFVAKEKLTQNLYAIKILDKLDDDAIERFYREIKLLINLRHSENIVRIHDYGQYEGLHFYVMDYEPKGSLVNFLGIVNVDFAFKVLNHISLGLIELHNNGGFHRDVKPHNILVSSDSFGKPIMKLSDFGLARTEDTSTFTNNPRGTTAYMSPQALEGQNYTIEDDIFSLGVTVTELLKGERIRTGRIYGETPSPKESRIQKLLGSMLSRNPKLRPNLTVIMRQSASKIPLRSP